MKTSKLLLLFPIALLLLLFPSHCIAQAEDTSLQKYSYHVIGFIGEKPSVGGTAFFVEYQSKFYLVSAWHCFSFKDAFTNAYDNPRLKAVNTIIVYRNVADVTSHQFTFISLFDSITQKPIYAEYRQNDTILDISAIEVARNPPFLFDYIPLTEANSKSVSLNDTIEYYGFPIIAGTQINISAYYHGQVIEKMPTRREFNINIDGHTGCSGSAVFKISKAGTLLQGVLFYALKDIFGSANKCRAVDISWLLDLFPETPPYHSWNFRRTYLTLAPKD